MVSSNVFALIPAGGSGARMASATPKQYLHLQGKTVLAHTVQALLDVAAIEQIVLVVAAGDEYAQLEPLAAWGDRVQLARVGGATRAHSVRNGLKVLRHRASANDWVLVHDAARPCVRSADIARMIDELQSDAVGGILAQPMADTVKRSDALGRVAATVPREQLWRAQTPQMFRIGTLQSALELQPEVTDEAQAIEALGLAPRLVPGPATNIKITYAEDLALAALILQAQSERGSA
jgi:2-C-methyl-D-erythritol 4-phosphate cytidylyltransferase